MADSKKNNRYRNPANDLIDAAVGGTKKAAGAVGSTAKKSVKATSAAASRTIKKESEAKSKDRSQLAKRKAELERRRKEAEKAKPKPTPTTKPTQGNYKSRFAGSRDRAHAEAKKITGAANPSPTPSTSPSSASAPTRSSTSSSSTPKPAGKVPASNAGMKNQDKDFRGNPNRKDSIASTLSELRGMGSGRKVSGVGPVSSGSDYAKGVASSKSSKPEDKSRYVAPNGQPYKGPAFGNDPKPAKTEAKKKEDDKKKMSLAERMRRRRAGLM